MKTLSLTHDDIHRGDLILVNQSHALHESAAADLAPVAESAPAVLLLSLIHI